MESEGDVDKPKEYETKLKLPEMQTKRQLITAAILPGVSDGEDWDKNEEESRKIEMKSESYCIWGGKRKEWQQTVVCNVKPGCRHRY